MRSVNYFFIAFLFISEVLFANDGAFYAKGNQLIPIFETDIQVKSEILNIEKVSSKQWKVEVNYEFFNPGKEKKITIGFEAFSPTGDVDGTPLEGHHPNIHDFTVLCNDQLLKYDISYVLDTTYYMNGIQNGLTLDDIMKKHLDNVNEVDFYYVYYFDALFKNGVNAIRHTYTMDLSEGVDELYTLNYVLTAASRWKGGLIEDFTLNLNAGDFQELYIANTFFNAPEDWVFTGTGKGRMVTETDPYISFFDVPNSLFYIRDGILVFRKKNFHPRGELNIFSPRSVWISANEPFSALNNHTLPFDNSMDNEIEEALTDTDRKILRNLPFARRGFVFQSPELKNYFERCRWYMPDKNYEGKIESLTEEEKDWVQRWK